MRRLLLTVVTAIFAVAAFAQVSKREMSQLQKITRVPQGMTQQKAAKLSADLKFSIPTVSKTSTLKKAPKITREDEMEMITEQPEGTLLTNMTRYAKGYYNFWGSVYATSTEGYVCDVVVSDDAVYIKDPISSVATDTWMKAVKGEGDTLIVDLPQYIYKEDYGDGDVYDYYLYKMKYEDNNYVVDTESQVIKYIMRNDSIIKLGEDELLGLAYEGEWAGYGELTAEITKVTDIAYTPSKPEEAKQYVLSYLGLASYTTDDSDPILEDGQTPLIVNVAIEGNDIYIGGLNQNEPDLWVKGTLDGNKAIFNRNSYLGIDTANNVYSYFMPSTAYWQYYEYYEDYEPTVDFKDQIVFDYDAEKQTLTCNDTHIAIVFGMRSPYVNYFYGEPSMTSYTEVAGTPQEVVFDTYNEYEDEYGFGNIAFYINSYSKEGDFMNPNKVYYNMYFDDELFTFYTDEYICFTEDMTDIPYTFADNFDIYVYGELHNVYFYSTGFSKIGVQVTYTGGGETHKSEIAWLDTSSIGNVSNNDNASAVKSVSYVDMSGRRVTNPSKGVFVKTITYSDGTIKNVKIIKK